MSIVTDVKKLKQVSEPIDLKEVKDVLEKIKVEFTEALKQAKKNKTPAPVGLSAIQIGINKQVAWIEHGDLKFALVNPVILKKKKPFIHSGEMCMSLPGIKVNTQRYDKIYFKDDINGKIWFEGFLAVVILHELDHMDGILITDRKVKAVEKIGRNEKCKCNSGKKYKHCCGK